MTGSAPRPPAYRAQLDALLQQYAIPPETAAALQPWMLASVLTVSEFSAQGYDTALAVDAWLAKQAHARHQPVLELETVAGQMALFSHLSAAEQLLFPRREPSTRSTTSEQADQAREIAPAWRDAESRPRWTRWRKRRPKTIPFPASSCKKYCSTNAIRDWPTASPNCWRVKTTVSPRSACCIWSARAACRNGCASADWRSSGFIKTVGRVLTRKRCCGEMVPFTWIEHVASPLPRECSTTELKGQTDVATRCQNRPDCRVAVFSVRTDHSAKSLFGQHLEQ